MKDDYEHKIGSLHELVDETLRQELQKAWRSLCIEDCDAAVLHCSRMIEGRRGLVGLIHKARNSRTEGRTLESQIEHLRCAGVIPRTVASDLHWIRVRANAARHPDETTSISEDDALTAIGRTLSALEWFYRVFERGPQIESVFTAEYRPVSVAARLTELASISSPCADEAIEPNSVEDAAGRIKAPYPLPRLQGRFVDREREMEGLLEFLSDERKPILFVIGPGGYGKTELVTRMLTATNGASTLDVPAGIVYIRCKGTLGADPLERFSPVWARFWVLGTR